MNLHRRAPEETAWVDRLSTAIGRRVAVSPITYREWKVIGLWGLAISMALL